MYACKFLPKIKIRISLLKSNKSNYKLQACDTKQKQDLKTFNLKTPFVKMAGIALKGQHDLISIMVPPKVSINEKFS